MVDKIITFCTLEYYPSAKRALVSLKKQFPRAEYQIWRPRNLSPEFKKQNKSILKHKIGAGYWVWKPEIIYQTLCGMAYGEDLMYTDAGILYSKIDHVTIQNKLKNRPFSENLRHRFLFVASKGIRILSIMTSSYDNPIGAHCQTQPIRTPYMWTNCTNSPTKEIR